MGFKKRAGLKGKRRHGEGGSAVILAESEAIMEEIQRVGRDYDADVSTIWTNLDFTGKESQIAH
jgi:hypothetical protein